MTSASQILSETIDVPGYGEALDPARIPPYTEDLGGGVTRRVNTDGDEYWYKDGKLHRDGDLPAIVYVDGYRSWWKHDQRHRESGPARTWPENRAEEYWINGKRINKPDLVQLDRP